MTTLLHASLIVLGLFYLGLVVAVLLETMVAGLDDDPLLNDDPDPAPASAPEDRP